MGNQALREALSALVDDQAEEIEIRRVLRACDEDDDTRRAWGRYQLARAVIRRELPAGPLMDISAAVSEAIAREGNLTVSAVRTTGWMQHAGRFAIAASVAGIVVLTSRLVMSPADTGNLADAGRSPAEATVAMPMGYGTSGLSARTVSVQPSMERSPDSRFSQEVTADTASVTAMQGMPSAEVQAHLFRVMQAHAAHTAPGSVNGMLPYARVPSPVADASPAAGQ